MSLEFYSGSTPKARKIHKCDLCHQEIQVGETYKRFAGKYEGDFFDTAKHMTCDDIVQRYVDGRCEEEYTDDAVMEDVADCVCSDCEQEEECPFTFYGRARCKKVIASYRAPEVHNE